MVNVAENEYTPSLIAGEFAASSSSGTAVFRASPHLIVSMHSTSSAFYEMTHAKGELTEAVMNRFLAEGILGSGGKWAVGTPAAIGRGGIDGLFFKTDTSGNVRDVLVSEAKYGTSTLGQTRSGPQMGSQWINERLSRTGRLYSSFVADGGSVQRGSSFAASQATDSVRVPLKGGGTAIVYRRSGKTYFFSSDKSVSKDELKMQIRRVSKFLNAAAEGRVTYRTRIFRYREAGGKHSITITDPKTHRRKVFHGSFDELPKRIQRILRQEFERLFISMGKSPAEARVLAKKACQDPRYFKNMAKQARWSWRYGLDRYAMAASVWAFGMAAGFDLLGQWLRGGKIDLKRSMKIGALGAFSAAAGYYGGTQISAFLYMTTAGRNIVQAMPLASIAGRSGAAALGAVGGGLIGATVFSYGMYFMGYVDLRAANRQAIQGAAATVGAALAAQGTVAVAMAYGTAGTGAAISGLSGAAASNAALSYLGGGTAAAGGGGMAAGAVAVGGIAAAAVISIYVGTTLMFKHLDAVEQQRVIQGRIQLVMERVAEGKQPEWAVW